MNECLSGGALIAFIIFIIQQSYKTWLDYKKYRSEVIFSKLHQERFDIIKELYRKMLILSQLIEEWMEDYAPLYKIDPDGWLEQEKSDEDQNRCKTILKTRTEIAIFLKQNKIYFSPELHYKIYRALNDMRFDIEHCIISFAARDKTIMERLNDYIIHGKPFKFRLKSKEYFIYYFPSLLHDIESELRKLIGSD